MVGQAGDMALKITLAATAHDDFTEEDFDSFVGRFAANNGVDTDSADLKIITSSRYKKYLMLDITYF